MSLRFDWIIIILKIYIRLDFLFTTGFMQKDWQFDLFFDIQLSFVFPKQKISFDLERDGKACLPLQSLLTYNMRQKTFSIHKSDVCLLKWLISEDFSYFSFDKNSLIYNSNGKPLLTAVLWFDFNIKRDFWLNSEYESRLKNASKIVWLFVKSLKTSESLDQILTALTLSAHNYPSTGYLLLSQ